MKDIYIFTLIITGICFHFNNVLLTGICQKNCHSFLNIFIKYVFVYRFKNDFVAMRNKHRAYYYVQLWWKIAILKGVQHLFGRKGSVCAVGRGASFPVIPPVGASFCRSRQWLFPASAKPFPPQIHRKLQHIAPRIPIHGEVLTAAAVNTSPWMEIRRGVWRLESVAVYVAGP